MTKETQKKQKIGTAKKLDILENQANIVYLSIGSNLGNRIKNIEKTKFYLQKYNIYIVNCSSYYESLSWPNINLPKYINIVIKVKTKNDPVELFKILKLIEKKLGRKNDVKNAPRTCDIDILDFNKKKIYITLKNIDNLQIPHPRLHERNFVLVPFHEICPNWKHPKFNQNIVNLLLKLTKSELTTIKLT